MAIDNKVSRREFVEAAGVAAGVAAVVGSAVAAGNLGFSAVLGSNSSSVASASIPVVNDGAGVATVDRAASAETLAFLGAVRPGSSVRGAEVLAVQDVTVGGIAVLLRDEQGSTFQVDIVRRDESGSVRGIAETASTSLFLSNEAQGSHPTVEAHGLVVMAIAGVLAANEAQGALAPRGLLTLAQRQVRFPRAVMKVSAA